MGELKRTPLYPLYKEYGAKTVEFGGWDMPVQFSSILQEHHAVRTTAGLFDVSHMGEFEVTGREATNFLQKLLSNDVAKLVPGAALYSPMLNPQGGCIDDLLVYAMSEGEFMVVVNAGNIEKDFLWMQEVAQNFDVHLTNKSDDVALLALQGPVAEKILQGLTDTRLDELKYYHFVNGKVKDKPAIISRTGYTGEDGFELYIASEDAAVLFRAILEAGVEYGVLPCGLGCRDTLRLEARLPLYGHELTDTISPLEAGLGIFVKLDKGEFIGKSVLTEQKSAGVRRKLVGIQIQEKGIPRADYKVLKDGKEVGWVTSGTMSPTLKVPIALAMLDVESATVGTSVQVDIRGKLTNGEVVKTPFYKRPAKA